MGSNTVRIVVQVVLGFVILALGYWLYLSITGPWEAVERERAITRTTQDRMTNVRTALVRHERELDRFPSSLDSLLIWVMQDSLSMAYPDSIFGTEGINLDSLLHSPRTGNRFEYALNDSGRIHIYLLRDPDTDDHIGSEEPDVTLLNAASWE